MVYPVAEPYHEATLKVSDIHTVSYTQHGKPDGKPVIFLLIASHGGPGFGTRNSDTVFFNPDIYRVILLDQRGAGKSEPTNDLRENTTWDLVADIEKMREALGIEKWLVFGGSWGSTLSLAYAETHPERCTALIIRGIFTFLQEEIDFLFKKGASYVWPEEWERFVSLIPENKRDNLIEAYYGLLTSPDEEVRLEAARRYSMWEGSIALLVPKPGGFGDQADDRWALSLARLEAHYMINKGFMPEGHLVSEEQLAKVREIPCIIVHGRYDLICPPHFAYNLKKKYGAKCDLRWAVDAGHSATEPTITKMLTQAADDFADL